MQVFVELSGVPINGTTPEIYSNEINIIILSHDDDDDVVYFYNA